MNEEKKNDSENRGYQPKGNIGQFGYQPHISKGKENTNSVENVKSSIKPPKGSGAKDA